MDYSTASLPDPTSHIRLVTVTASENNAASCVFSVWPLSNSPAYHAISYTWGEPTPTEEVLINGESVSVRKNCAGALRQAVDFSLAQDVCLWIDALCIDQTNTSEKNAQVALMGEIFHQAKHVLICLGELNDDDGEYALQAIRHHGMKYDVPPILRQHERGPSAEVNLLRFVSSLSGLTRRPYWKRVWIIQEMFLGMTKSAHVCSGEVSVPLLSLLPEIRSAGQYLRRIERVPTTRTINEQDLVDSGLLGASIEILEAVRSIREKFDWDCYHVLTSPFDFESGLPKLHFSRLLKVLSASECEDPRDRVYGGLALTDWRTATPISPDYNKSAYELAKEILRDHVPAFDAVKVIQSLRIASTDANIRAGVTLRQQCTDADLLRQIDSPETSPSTKDKAKVRTGGYILPDFDVSDENIGICDGGGTKPIRIKDPDPSSSTIYEELVPIETKPGDVLIYPEQKRQDYLMVRKVGSIYAFLGRGVHIGPPEQFVQSAIGGMRCSLQLYFDLDDFMIVTATRDTAQDAMSCVKTRVCATPFSSFAEMAGGSSLWSPASSFRNI